MVKYSDKMFAYKSVILTENGHCIQRKLNAKEKVLIMENVKLHSEDYLPKLTVKFQLAFFKNVIHDNTFIEETKAVKIQKEMEATIHIN